MVHLYITFTVLLLLFFADFHVCVTTSTTSFTTTPFTTSQQQVQVTCYHGQYWRQLQSSPETMAMVNLMCNTTTSSSEFGNSKINIDACFGCFSRVISQAQNEMFVDELSSCASTYLEETVYQTCAQELARAVAEKETTPTNCAKTNKSFCDFERCVHRFDTLNLINSCIKEVRELNAGNESGEIDEAKIYTNVTACILAKIQCRNSGGQIGTPQYQINWPYQTSALFVTADFDLRVTNMPHVNMGLMCQYGTNNVGVAQWSNATC